MKEFSIDEMRAILKNLDPNESIDAQDPRYHPLHVDDKGKIVDWTKPLRTTILLKPEGSCQLFSGFIGTGKSSELKSLRNRLENEGMVVIYADIEKYHDLTHVLTIQNLLSEQLTVLIIEVGKLPEERLLLIKERLISFLMKWPKVSVILLLEREELQSEILSHAKLGFQKAGLAPANL